MKKMYGESIAEFRKAVALSNNGSYQLSGLAFAFVKSGKKAEAYEILDQLKNRQKNEYVDPENLAIIYAALGEKDQAFANLEQAYKARSIGMLYLKVTPSYDDEFRSDPRFQNLLRRIGLP